MKQLTHYSKNGHDFALVERRAKFAIFHGKSRSNKSETFEVIEIQSHDGRDFNGVHCDPAEFPPSNNQWGAKGWTKQTLEAATEKLNQLTNQ